MYSDKVMEHFKNPRNIGVMDDADVVIQVGEPSCHDSLLLFLKIAAIATSSIATEMAKGKSLVDVLMLTDEQVTAALDGLPQEKIHCSIIAVKALQEGILRYLSAEWKKEFEDS